MLMLVRKSFLNHTRYLSRKSITRNTSKFDSHYLEARDANFTQLSPLSFLRRAKQLYADKACYYVKDQQVTWGEMHDRVAKFSSILSERFNINRFQVVSMLSPNTHAAMELHFSVPGNQGILHSINTRLDDAGVAFQLQHAESTLLVVDVEFLPLARNALALLPQHKRPPLLAISSTEIAISDLSGVVGEYEDLIRQGDPNYSLHQPLHEFDAMTLNYTSGTTGDPKGVVTHHRGMYLNSMANAVELNMMNFPKYLWIVPLFHCNGWCFPYTMALTGGTSFFLRQIRPQGIFEMISKYKIQFMAGAPVIMISMLNHANRIKFTHSVTYMTAGAAPPPVIIQRFEEEIGVQVRTAYGLTEVYGPMSSSIPNDDEEGDVSARCHLAYNCITESMTVVDTKFGQLVPFDGKTIGEIVIRGNGVMKGYLLNEEGTKKAFRGGVFHTGDLGVVHASGRIEIKDRLKDVIISGGENICSIELENTLQQHDAVVEAAVVAMHDDFWGEVPVAFVNLSSSVSEDSLIEWSKANMARYKVPKKFIVVEALPRTSTGKVQKHVLRNLLLV